MLEPTQERQAPERLLKRKRSLQTVVARGKGAVDPASQLADAEHAVLAEGATVWSASLSLVDMRSGANSYYKLQIIASTAAVRLYHFPMIIPIEFARL